MSEVTVSLADIIKDDGAENMLILLLSGLATGNSLSSRYGTITKTSETTFEFEVNRTTITQITTEDGDDPEDELRGLYE